MKPTEPATAVFRLSAVCAGVDAGDAAVGAGNARQPCFRLSVLAELLLAERLKRAIAARGAGATAATADPPS